MYKDNNNNNDKIASFHPHPPKKNSQISTHFGN